MFEILGICLQVRFSESNKSSYLIWYKFPSLFKAQSKPEVNPILIIFLLFVSLIPFQAEIYSVVLS